MRRWNGWGDATTVVELPAQGAVFLHERLGEGRALPDATLEAALARVPVSRLAEHALYSIDAHDRLLHARGQSLPDWLALREGALGNYPDAVAFPETAEHIRQLLALAQAQDLCLIPYGGGTSVAGHINPPDSARPVVTVSLARMSRLIDLDEQSLLATFGPGASGPQVESQLRARGYTLGHFPQSWELSTLGGWVASRSSGQQSLRYGRIEQLFAGGTLETFAGPLQIPTFPASAAGLICVKWCWVAKGVSGSFPRSRCGSARCRPMSVSMVCFCPVGTRRCRPSGNWRKRGCRCRCCDCPTRWRPKPNWRWPVIHSKSPGWKNT